MSALFGLFDNPMMLLLLGTIAVLLFGERLPEVAKSFGKGLMELKKGLHGIQNELQNAINTADLGDNARRADSSASRHRMRAAESSSFLGDSDDREEATAPKFEPPAAADGSTS